MATTLNPDVICSALQTPAPRHGIHDKTGLGHWLTVVTVFTETDETFLVTGYDCQNPRLSACRKVAPVKISSIYAVIERDNPAIAMLGVQKEPHCHYTTD